MNINLENNDIKAAARVRSGIGISLIVALGLLAAGPASAEPIPIAAVAPLTGERAWSGEQSRRGAEMAAADLNAAGGVLGHRLRLLIEDDAADPGQAVAVAHKLVADGVVFVDGHRSSDASIAASAVYAAAEIVQISPSSTSPRLTEQGFANVFRISGRDDRQGVVAGDYLAARLGGRRVAIVHDGSAYGLGLATRTRARFNQQGGKEALFAEYAPRQRDYSVLVEALQTAAVEVLYIGGYSSEAGLIARQAAERGVSLQLVAGDALHNVDFWMIAGQAGQSARFTFDVDPRTLPAAAEVVRRFRQSGYEPEGYTLHSYAAIQVWVQAVERAGSFAAERVIEALRTGEFDTVIGPLEFDARGDLKHHRYVWYEWDNGAIRRVE